MHTIMQDERTVIKAFLVAMVMLSMAVVFYGCNTFNRIVKNEALVSQLAVEAATARVLHDKPTWKNDAIRITGNALTFIDGNASVNLASVEAYVKGMVNWSRLVPEEQALVSVLISEVVHNLEDSFRAEHVIEPAAQMIQVRQVVLWINEAAKRQ